MSGAVVVSIFASALPNAFCSNASASSLIDASAQLSFEAAATALSPAEVAARLRTAGLLSAWGYLAPDAVVVAAHAAARNNASATANNAAAVAATAAAAEASLPARVATVAADDALLLLAAHWQRAQAAALAPPQPFAVAGDAMGECARSPVVGWARAAAPVLHCHDPAAAAALAALMFGHFAPSGASVTDASSGGSSGGAAVAGVLLSGPPGSGKSALLRALAAACGAAVAVVTYASLRARALMTTPALAGAPPPLGTAAAAAPGAAAAAAAAATAATSLALATAAQTLFAEALARAHLATPVANPAAGTVATTPAPAPLPRVVIVFEDAHEFLPAATVASPDVAQVTAALAAAAAAVGAAAGAGGGSRVLLAATTDAVGRVSGSARSMLFPTDVALPPPTQRGRGRVLAALLAALANNADVAAVDDGSVAAVGGLSVEVASAVALELHPTDPARTSIERALQHQQQQKRQLQHTHGDGLFASALEQLRGVTLGDVAAVAHTAQRLSIARALASSSSNSAGSDAQTDAVVTAADVLAAAAHVGTLARSFSPLAEPLDPLRALGFAPLAGLAGPKQALREALRWPLDHAPLFARLGLATAAASGLLLHGPSGCGKTALARAAAAEFSLTMVPLSAAALLRAGVGDSERYLRQVFRAAAASAPAVIVFDEIHSVFPAPADGSDGGNDDEEGEGGSTLLSEMLQLLDARAASSAAAVSAAALQGPEAEAEAVAAARASFVALVATSPAPALVHPALLRAGRLERVVHVGRPTAADCAALVLAAARPLLEAGAGGWDAAAVARVAVAAAEAGLSAVAVREAWVRAEAKAEERDALRSWGATATDADCTAQSPESDAGVAMTAIPASTSASSGTWRGGPVPLERDVVRAMKKLRRNRLEP